MNLGEPLGKIVNASDADFDVVTSSDEWVLVDFWAPWCGPCRAIAPVLEQIAGERDITIAKVNTDTNQITPGRYGVRSIPNLVLFRGGQVVDNMTGALPKPSMDDWLNRHMA